MTPGAAQDKKDEVTRLIEMATKEAELEEKQAALGDTKDTELRSRLNKLKGATRDAPLSGQIGMGLLSLSLSPEVVRTCMLK